MTRTRTRGASTRGKSQQVAESSANNATTLTVLGSVKEIFAKYGLHPDRMIRASKGETAYPVLRFQVKGSETVTIHGNDFKPEGIHGIVLSKNANTYLTPEDVVVDTTSSVGVDLMLEDLETLQIAHRIDPITQQDLGLIVITNSANGGFEAADWWVL